MSILDTLTDVSSIGGMLGQAVSGIGSLIQGARSDVSYNKWARKNYEVQKKYADWQMQQQEIARDREDTAVQRRADDLRRAGLSPVLAAGSAAQTMAPIKVEAPQRMPDKFGTGLDKAGQAMLSMTQMADIARTVSQNELIKLQQRKELKEMHGIDLDNARKLWDLDIYREAGVASNTAGFTKELINLVNMVLGTRSNASPFSNVFKNMLNKSKQKALEEANKPAEPMKAPWWIPIHNWLGEMELNADELIKKIYEFKRGKRGD